MRRSSTCSSGWRVFYNSQLDSVQRTHLLYFSYYRIARAFTGWPLSDIRNMTSRERMYWIDFIKWEEQRMQILKDNPVNA